MFMSEKHAGTALALVATAIAIAVVRKKWGSKRPPYPPGPKGYPIIGNVFDFPENPIWEGLARMAQEHNTDILYLNMMGSPMVVLNNAEVAKELLERRSVVYSDRPRFPMVNELMECSWSFAMMHYAVQQFDDKIHNAVNVFLRRLSDSPGRFLHHVHFLTGSLTLSVSYGINVESESDGFYAASEEAMDAVSAALLPGAFLVDAFPLLKYVPAWFPGAGFKRFAKAAKRSLDNLADLPFQHVKKTFQADAINTSSLVATCLEELPELAQDGVDEEAIRAVAATAFLGGEETTSSTIKSFFQAITMHPETVRLAQKELDEVLGGERLPDFSDKEQLPYISAVMKEVLRWRPPTPLGTPHRLMEDSVYEGWFIPAGATVFHNTWTLFRDESVYPNADLFDPHRFLKDGQISPDVIDPESLIFGWGRRICPGRYFAMRLFFLTVARTLATFEITTGLDDDGNPIPPDGGFTHGLISNPLPFRSNIKPRSAQALSLVPGQ